MKEKERYTLLSCWCITDYETNNIIDGYKNIISLLNQQDKRIKELEETNRVLSSELTKNNIIKQDHIETCCGIPIFEIPKIKEENQQLKQQLHDLPKNILKDIQENFDCKQYCEIRKYYDQQYIWFNYVAFNDFLDTILKKHGGEE